MKYRFLLLLPLLVSTAASVASGQNRAQVIAEAFNKSRHSIRERHGVRREKYKEVRSQPAALPNPENYSGTYQVSGLDFVLKIGVAADGRVEGAGREPLRGPVDATVPFTLRNTRVNGALLTGTKVFANGRTEAFEAVFLESTSFDSPTGKGTKTFGLGMTGNYFVTDGLSVDRLFFEKR